MGAKFWTRIFNTIDQKELIKQWNKVVKQELSKAIKQKIKEEEKEQKIEYSDIKATMSSNKFRKAPKEKAQYFPRFYMKKGQDKCYYWIVETKGKVKRWKKMSDRDFLGMVIYDEIPSSFGEGKGTFIMADKQVKTMEEAEKYIYETHQKWNPALAVRVNNKTVIGGWVAA